MWPRWRRIVSCSALLAAIFSLLLAGQEFAAGQATPAQTHSTGSRPDIEGTWNYSTLTPLERPHELDGKPFLTEPEAEYLRRSILQQIDADRRDGPREVDVNRSYNQLFWDGGTKLARIGNTIPTSLIIDPPDGRIPPLLPEAQKREAARRSGRQMRGRADSWEDRNLLERCLTSGAPRLPDGYNNNVQIIVTADAVMITQEMIHETRVIHLDGRPHLSPNVRLWLGDSVGHWEGDTLIVDTTNYKDDIRLNFVRCCGPAGGSLHVVERVHRITAYTIDYRYTVDDPTTYTRPWTVALPLTKSDQRIYEYACHEGNYAMEDMLRGARAQDEAAEEANRKH